MTAATSMMAKSKLTGYFGHGRPWSGAGYRTIVVSRQSAELGPRPLNCLARLFWSTPVRACRRDRCPTSGRLRWRATTKASSARTGRRATPRWQRIAARVARPSIRPVPRRSQTPSAVPIQRIAAMNTISTVTSVVKQRRRYPERDEGLNLRDRRALPSENRARDLHVNF